MLYRVNFLRKSALARKGGGGGGGGGANRRRTRETFYLHRPSVLSPLPLSPKDISFDTLGPPAIFARHHLLNPLRKKRLSASMYSLLYTVTYPTGTSLRPFLKKKTLERKQEFKIVEKERVYVLCSEKIFI